ncbi:MAG: hypothetical protein FWH27_16360 [Planctomycetaceae bacterium]|nr:hypothetical protein [Planctomycetaceae bacterium]
MKADVIIDQETQKVKLILDWKAGNNGGQTILTLRSIVKSSRWSLFWTA